MKESQDPVAIERFRGEAPTRDLRHWHSLFANDRSFPIESHRALVGPILVWIRRLLRPFVRLPQSDLWERQRVFNLIVLERLEAADNLAHQVSLIEQRLASLEASYKLGLDEVMRYNDALYSRVDAKLDGHRELAREQVATLRSLIDRARSAAKPAEEQEASTESPGAALAALDDAHYLAFENDQRGSKEAVKARIERYSDDLRNAGRVVDLGCGRGEVLEFLQEQGIDACGVDGNAAMVNHCRERGLRTVQADLNDYLASIADASVGAITCFHVVEHLNLSQTSRMIREAFRVLEPDGLLLIETPNPLSVVVGASAFWIDPTHRRPLHPNGLRSLLEAAGFSSVEIRSSEPFPDSDRLPAVRPSAEDPSHTELVVEINRLRDRLDGLLFGDRDFAALALR